MCATTHSWVCDFVFGLIRTCTTSFVLEIDVCDLYEKILMWGWICAFIYVGNDSFICAPWLIHVRAMTHLYVCHDSFIRLVWECMSAWWLIRTCAVTYSYVRRDIFIRAPWHIHTCAMIHPWLIQMCGMTRLHVCNHSLTCATWLIHMCDMTHSYMFLPQNPPNPETQLPRYKFKLNQNLHLNLYLKKPRNLSFCGGFQRCMGVATISRPLKIKCLFCRI